MNHNSINIADLGYKVYDQWIRQLLWVEICKIKETKLFLLASK